MDRIIEQITSLKLDSKVKITVNDKTDIYTVTKIADECYDLIIDENRSYGLSCINITDIIGSLISDYAVGTLQDIEIVQKKIDPLDEAIQQEQSLEKYMSEHTATFLRMNERRYLQEVNKHKQYADWLKELKSLRENKSSKVYICRGYNKALEKVFEYLCENYIAWAIDADNECLLFDDECAYFSEIKEKVFKILQEEEYGQNN